METQKDAQRRILYLVDGDGDGWDPPVRQATVLGRVQLANGNRGWLVEIEPPLAAWRDRVPEIGRAVLADHYVGTSLDDLIERGIGLWPSHPIAPVYVCTAVPPATLEQTAFADGELTIAHWADAALRPDAFPGPGHRPMSGRERLRPALLKLEDVLRFAHAPIAEYLAPGLPEDEVQNKLDAVGIDACEELVTWFGWHDGTSANDGLGSQTRELQPGVRLLSFDQALEQHRIIHGELLAKKRIGADRPDRFPADIVPITRHDGSSHDVVSCGRADAGSTWFVSRDEPPEPNGPHLADLVERLWGRWWHGAYRWDGERWIFGPQGLLGIGPNVPW